MLILVQGKESTAVCQHRIVSDNSCTLVAHDGATKAVADVCLDYKALLIVDPE